MNIQRTNLLLLDNQIKMKEEGTAPVSAPVEQAGAEPKNIMKAMNMQGQANYMNNLAFHGLKSKAATYALVGLLTLGAASTLTSCSDDIRVEQRVDVDMASVAQLAAEMQEFIDLQKQQQKIDAQRWQEFVNFKNELLDLIRNGQITEAEFYNRMFDYMVKVTANQDLIIKQLQNNGMSQEEANKLIQQLINDVNSGRIDAKEAWAQIQALLQSIDANVAAIKDAIGKYYYDDKDVLAKLDKIIEQNNTQINQGNSQIEQGNRGLALLNNIYALLQKGVSKDDIKVLIDYAAKGDADINKLIKLVEALNKNVEKVDQNITGGREENKQFAADVIETLNKLGMENADNFTTVINKMNSLDNGAADLRALIQSFMNAYKDGHKITTGQLKDLIDAVNNISISGGSADLTSIENMLKELVGLTKDNKGLLTSIDAKIDLINVVENAILDEVKAIHQGVQNIPNYEKELADIKKLLEDLKNKPDYDDSKVLKELMEINETVKTRDFCDCECGSGHNEQIID